MIRHEKDLSVRTEHAMRDGTGDIEAIRLYSREEMDGHARVCDVFTFDPGDSIGPHPHIGEGELYYILSGTATVTEDGRDTVLRAGDSAYCPDGHTHSIVNSGDGPMRMLAVVFVG